ncbi:MAG TPA: hypothetical protein VEJ18_09685 [Planctomycetota bacterium]|nr:hypothetical protein [Planctomycetota bacterium]
MRNAWLLVTGLVWAAMMGILVHREILPYYEFQQAPSYRARLRDRTVPEVERRAVYFASGREPIGRSETLVEPLPEGGAWLRSRFTLRMSAFTPIPLAEDQLTMSSDVRVDADYQLAEFRLQARIQGLPVRVEAKREGEKLRTTYNLSLLGKGERVLDLPPDATISDNFLPFVGGGRLEQGKKWRLRILDLSSLASGRQEMGFTEMYATVVGREVVNVGGRDVPAWKVMVQEQPNDEPEKWAYQLWVEEGGAVVQQLMKINRLPCTIALEERRELTPEQAKAFPWSIDVPR